MKFVESLPIRKVSGIGNVTEQLLKRVLGIETCSDLYHKRGHLLLLFSEISAGNSVILRYFSLSTILISLFPTFFFFPCFHKSFKESSINDVTQFWTIVDPPPPIVTRFITKALVLSPQNPRPPPPPNTVTSYKDDP